MRRVIFAIWMFLAVCGFFASLSISIIKHYFPRFIMVARVLNGDE